MDENERQEFTLEDIMKEFGADAAEQDADSLQPEEIPEELLEDLDVQIFGQTAKSEDVTGDTIRLNAEDLDQITAAQNMGSDTVRFEPITTDTIRLDRSQLPKGEVRIAQPIEEEEESAPVEKEEAFSGQWEPEYEQPMGEYVPPQPIVFHPQSRLRELKRKLVAGPEKRYYELSEVGLGRLQMAMLMCVILVLISGIVSALYAIGKISADRTRLMVFGQLLMMLLAALPGSFQLIEGVADLFKKRFTLNTLLAITFVACCVDAAFCLQARRVPCCAAFSLEMLMSLWSDYHKRSTEQGMMDTMRKATRLDKISSVADYYEGQKGLLRDQAQVEDFMDTYQTVGAPEKVMNWYALAALAVSLAIAVVAGIMHGLASGVQVLAVSLLAAMPASAFISLTRPWAVLERQMHKLGSVLCGWQGVRGLAGKSVFPVTHEDLFPAGSAKMNGVKFFGNREPDEIVAYCTALVVADGGGLSPLFTQVLDSRNGRHYDVQQLQSYPGGIGGEVCGESVLVGMLPFLRDMGVDVPEGIRVNQAVCVAIDGELCGLFAVTYEKNKAAAAGVNVLCSDRGIKTLLTNSDFMLTESFLRGKLGVNPKRIAMPEHGVCQQLREQKPEENAPALVVSTKDGLAPFAYGVAGARALRTASILGVIVHMTGGILGLAIMLILTVLGRMDLLTPLNMFLYQLVWLIPGFLVTQWTKMM